jgi:hypothetical protein
MPVYNLNEFIAEAEATNDLLKEDWKNRAVDLVGEVVEFLSIRSPVLTGAYRASHEVAHGVDGNGPSIYEHPFRPDPNKPVPGTTVKFQPPNPGDAIRDAKRELKPYESFSFRNQRFYARIPIELGGPRMAPRRVYGVTNDFARAVLLDIIEAPSRVSGVND